MIRGFGNAVLIVMFVSLLDRHFYAGRHIDAALACVAGNPAFVRAVMMPLAHRDVSVLQRFGITFEMRQVPARKQALNSLDIMRGCRRVQSGK